MWGGLGRLSWLCAQLPCQARPAIWPASAACAPLLPCPSPPPPSAACAPCCRVPVPASSAACLRTHAASTPEPFLPPPPFPSSLQAVAIQEAFKDCTFAVPNLDVDTLLFDASALRCGMEGGEGEAVGQHAGPRGHDGSESEARITPDMGYNRVLAALQKQHLNTFFGERGWEGCVWQQRVRAPW